MFGKLADTFGKRERETLLFINDIQLFKREKDIEPNFEVTSSPTWSKVLEVRKRSVLDEWLRCEQ